MRPFLITALALLAGTAAAQDLPATQVDPLAPQTDAKKDDTSTSQADKDKVSPATTAMPTAPKVEESPSANLNILGGFFVALGQIPAPKTEGQPAPAPSGLFAKIGQMIISSKRQIDEAKRNGGDAAAEPIATATVIEVAEVLTAQSPADVAPEVLTAARVQTATVLNRAGSDDDKRPYTASLGLSEAVLSSDPDNRDALNTAAGAQYGLGRYPDAVRSATRVADAHKDDERAYTTRALAYYQMKEYAQAFEDSQRALALNPNNETAFQVSKLAKPRVTTASDLKLDAAQKHIAEQVAREYKGQLEEQGRARQPGPPARISGPAATSDKAVAQLLHRSAEKVKLQGGGGVGDGFLVPAEEARRGGAGLQGVG
ncbi:MAG: ankyrin repeat-containing protein, partial [Elusimicrobia bacterium]